MLRVVSYARVSTGAQAQSGFSTDAQHQAVGREALLRGWQVAERITDDAVSGTVPAQRRPKLAAALDRLARGRLDVLVVARSDRLARSLLELLHLHERAQDEGWTLVALDLPVGIAGPEGRLFIGLRGLVAEFEAAMARARTTDALAVVRSRGVRLGRPSRHGKATKELAARRRAEGASHGQIAAELTSLGIPTPTGKTVWTRSSAQSLLRTVAHDAAACARAEAHRKAHGLPGDTGAPPRQAV